MNNQESMVERRLRQNVDTVEQQSARIAELEAQLAAAQAEVTRLRELNRELASEENHFQEQEAAHSGEGA